MYTSDSNLKPKYPTDVILCDLSNAFDVINHKILKNKLENYGIRVQCQNLDGKLSNK